MSKDVQNAWRSFKSGNWQQTVDVRDFIQQNILPYEGDESFLKPATSATTTLWNKVMEGIKIENKTHAPLDFDVDTPSTITSHKPGYIEKNLEKIVGLQTDAPLKRAIMPNGGIRMVETSCQTYGKELNPAVKETFTKYRKTHNEGVFSAYSEDILNCRKTGVITGLPDAYGRGRIIGDYRRVALYGIDFLIEQRQGDKTAMDHLEMTEAVIGLREEITEQLKALADMKKMAASYGFDISLPATNAQEAVQWTYFAYLAAIKSQNGAAMSLGRASSFLDIYIQRDLAEGTLTEIEAQEIIDHFVMKLRMVRFLRTPEYDELFSGDPIWATESLGGMALDGRSLVTKTSFRFLQTLYNMGSSPEPNMTVLWSESLPQGWKEFCSKVSIDTSSIQYENDDLMRPDLKSDDYAIACCVSPMVVGKQMQFFGARANIAKMLLYAINGGRDEKIGLQVGPKTDIMMDEVLNYDKVMASLDKMMDWLAFQYVSALNIIHYMHDKYSYESALMALHDSDVYRTLACGMAGLSVATDSLSAIKYAQVRPIRNAEGLAVDFEIKGEYPCFGNDDDRVDAIAVGLVTGFMTKIKKLKTYRNAVHTQSILTITSNVVYGKKTGSTPDGRKAGMPFAPGANPMHGRDVNGAVASLSSVAKIPFESAQDGISYTFSIVPNALGKAQLDQKKNLVTLMDGYFHNDPANKNNKNGSWEGGQHLNVNVLNRETLEDAMAHPEKYPQLTIRVSGYAVRFNSLTEEQKKEVISRTFTTMM